MTPEQRRTRMAMVIVAQSEYDHWDQLTNVPDAVEKLAATLGSSGYELDLVKLEHGGEKPEVEHALDEWLGQLSTTDCVLVYWIGHGTWDGLHYLVTRESPKSKLSSAKALPTRDLGNLVVNSPAAKVLVILDTCYSSSGAQGIAQEILNIANQRTGVPGQLWCIAVIPSASALQKAQEGAFCRAFVSVLTDPQHPARTWGDGDDLISVGDLADALVGVQSEMQPGWQPPIPVIAGVGQRFLPNPRYAPRQAVVDVETKQHLLELPKALEIATRGIEVGEAGWYFRGRTEILRRVVQWLQHPADGLLVLTGPPGSGKSAVLGRVVVLSDSTYRQEAGEAIGEIPEGTVPSEPVDAALHIKGMTLGQCRRTIGEAFGIEAPAEGLETDQLIQAVSKLDRSPTLVVDALDESSEPRTIGAMLRDLAMHGGAHVLVGTRRSPDGRVIPQGEDRHSRLRALFGDHVGILDLEDEASSDEDIAAYVAARLEDSRHRGDQDGIARAAAAVAEKAGGIFLYARVVSRTLQEALHLDGPLPESALDAFVRDLTDRFGEEKDRVDGLLAGLGWAEGSGLSRRTWSPVATAVSANGPIYGDVDVSWVLARAGWHILEASEDGQTVYRLAHQAFTDHYRRKAANPKEVHRQIAEALSTNISGVRWLDVDPYVCRHLVDHAAAGGVLDRFVYDPGYLAVADPFRLLAAFPMLVDSEARRIAALYRRVGNRLTRADPIERMALLHLTGCQEEPELAARLEPLLASRWRCAWARWQQSAPHTIFARIPGPVVSAALGEVDGKDVAISGGSDGIVRSCDPRTGQPLGEPVGGHDGEVTSVVLGDIDGEPAIVSGGTDGAVRVWDARTGQQRGEALTGHDGAVTAMGVGKLEGRPVAVSGGWDKTVRMWDLRSHCSMGEPLLGHEDGVAAIAMGEIDGRSIAVSGSGDEMVVLWDLATRQQIGSPLRPNPPGAIAALAMGELDGLPVAISGSWNGAVVAWDLRSKTPLWESPFGHAGGIVAAAVTEAEDLPVVISGSWDETVKFWDLRSGAQVGEPRYVRAGGLTALALGLMKGEPAAISGSGDGTLRTWELAGTEISPAASSSRGRTTAVAIREVKGAPVVVSGGDDGTIEIWDRQGNRLSVIDGPSPVFALDVGEVDRSTVISGGWDGTIRSWDMDSGNPLAEPLEGHTAWVSAVAIGDVDGRPVVVSGSGDGTVRVWDLGARIPIGKPFKGHDGGVSAVALGDVDGRPVVISGSWDKTMRAWDLHTWDAIGEPFGGHVEEISAVALGRVEGRPIAISGGWDGTVRVWDMREANILGEPLLGHAGSVTALTVGEVGGSPVVISGGGDETIRVWGLLRPAKTATIEIGSPIWAVSFAPPNRIAVGTSLGLVVVEVESIETGAKID